MRSKTYAYALLAVAVLFATPFSTFAQTILRADINVDGITDLADYSIFAPDLFKTGPGFQTDFNQDELVDVADYGIMAAEFLMTGTAAPINSKAMGKWIPNTKYDTCPTTVHDSYFVVGPDGKKYPTWHAPVHTYANGTKCTFGHDHGRDPKGYQYWDEIRTHFAFDANKNGQIETSELATAGIPFGYANEQIDAYYAANPSPKSFMRHEDHVGHKVEYANGEGDIGDGTDPFDTSMTGGVVVPVKSKTAGRKWDPSGIRCYHFHKLHQGVSTPDALTNNLHEIVMHTKCTSTIAQFAPSTTLMVGMVAFGAPGEFTKFCEEDRFTEIVLGTTDANKNWPGVRDQGQRNIITRDCVEKTVLVPSNQFSGFPYELWDGSFTIRTAAGKPIATNFGGWEVLDAIRYYNPASPNRISYTTDWCYEIEPNGDRARGGDCQAMTKNGTLKDIKWDDPRSYYRGLKRGQYVNPHQIDNAGGSTIWYTDAFGNNGRTTPFPGSVKQFVTAGKAVLTGLSTDPRIVLRNHNDGGRTVHAPN